MSRGGTRIAGLGKKLGRPAKAKTETERILAFIKQPKAFEHYLAVRLKRYRLTRAEFEKLLAEQKGCCALCELPLREHWQVDHDHFTGKMRGLLHLKCNVFLGNGEENPLRFEQAIAYLKKHNKFLT
jgi:hypothetical protein